MSGFSLSPEASLDLRGIHAFIAEDNIHAAGRVRKRILEACRLLAANPGIGHRRWDLTDEQVRFWPVGSYLVIYDPATRPLGVVRIIHAARDLKGLLAGM